MNPKLKIKLNPRPKLNFKPKLMPKPQVALALFVGSVCPVCLGLYLATISPRRRKNLIASPLWERLRITPAMAARWAWN